MKATAIILSGALLGALAGGAVPTNPEGVPITGRIAQLQGETGTVTWAAADAGAGEITLGTGTVLPPGMTVNVGGQVVTFNLDAQTAGTHEATLVLDFYRMPDIDAWAGPQLRMRHTVCVQWHVLPSDASPFLTGLGDILATPSP